MKKRELLKKTILLFLLIFFSVWTPFLYWNRSDHFKISKLVVDSSYRSEWDVEAKSSDVLNQGFSYFAQGAQSFVFLSEDGQYVLKFFKQNRWQHPWRMACSKYILRKPEKIRLRQGFFHQLNGASIAYKHAADLTGLVYAHLNPTDHLPITTAFKDPFGLPFHLDINRYRFVIQKKAIPLESAISDAVKAGDRELFQRLVQSFSHLIDSRACRGIRNLDIKVVQNFGFIENQALELDFGHYIYDEISSPNLEKEAFLSKFQEFLLKNYPDWIQPVHSRLVPKH